MSAEALLRLAACALPAEDRRRWLDEWLAELDAADEKRRFAVGILAGAGRMAAELRVRREVLRAANASHGGYSRAVGRPPYNA